MREYRFTDKSEWGPGPWQDEPDKISWTDAATGLPCLIVRGNSGALCGYVGVTEGHPLYEVMYGSSGHTWPECHGGVTFTSECQEDEEQGVCHIPEPGQSPDVWWIGFDCAHANDATPRLDADLRAVRARIPELEPPTSGLFARHYRHVAYVTSVIKDMAAELKVMT